MLFIISNSIIMKNLINVQKITEIPTFYPCEFLKFCIEYSLKPPNISSKNGKALVVMLNNIDKWSDAPIWDKNSIKNATKSWFKYLG